MTKLWQARVQAFFVQAGSLITVAITGALLSEDFKALVITHFGDTFITSSALLFLTGLFSHIRNRLALKKLAGSGDYRDTVVLI